MAVSAQDIIDLFISTGTDIEYGKTGSETSDQRAQRIADQVNRGDRDLAGVEQSLSWIRSQGGIYEAPPVPDAPPPIEDSIESAEELRVTFAWLPPEAMEKYIDAYVGSGDSTIAWAQVRADPRYEQWFPGNMTEDGRPRYSEDLYAAVIASYDDVFRSVGIDGVALAAMKEEYGRLIAGDVSPQELEANRVAPMYERIVSASDAIKSYYASEFGVELGISELMASAMNPALGEKVLTKQISLAEIGGEAAESGFNIGSNLTEKLFESGKVGKAEADKLFQQAENLLPTLQVLAARHVDPDDTFDINEFVAADIFQDPTQRRRMNRLIAQEKASFTDSSLNYKRSERTGGVTGLAKL